MRGTASFSLIRRATARVSAPSASDRVAEGRLIPAGFFDIYPSDDAAEFNGAWSVYPFFPSGVIAVSGIEQGLFVLARQQ